jgi:hypothetical protein
MHENTSFITRTSSLYVAMPRLSINLETTAYEVKMECKNYIMRAYNFYS